MRAGKLPASTAYENGRALPIINHARPRRQF